MKKSNKTIFDINMIIRLEITADKYVGLYIYNIIRMKHKKGIEKLYKSKQNSVKVQLLWKNSN